MTDPITLADQQRRRSARERRQMEFEHNRLWAALEHAAQLAELARYDDMASDLRILRRKVAADIDRGRCEDVHG